MVFNSSFVILLPHISNIDICLNSSGLSFSFFCRGVYCLPVTTSPSGDKSKFLQWLTRSISASFKGISLSEQKNPSPSKQKLQYRQYCAIILHPSFALTPQISQKNVSPFYAALKYLPLPISQIVRKIPHFFL